MKLIVQIPCYNEEQTIRQVVAEIPRHIEGVEAVEVLVIDDGSTDRTVEVARSAGADHVVQHKNHRGLARAFRTGIESCLSLGADIIVNTDGDNQYAGRDIPKLIAPILARKADIVVGDRQTKRLAHFSATKKFLQMFGSWMVRALSKTKLPDAVSGFRAFSKEAAMQLNVISPFSYTIETIIQASNRRLAITSVPVATNETTRKSRLYRSIPVFLQQSGVTMLRMYTMFRPLRAFSYLGVVLTLIGIAPTLRFLYFYFVTGSGKGHIQSLVIGGAFLVIGLIAFMLGLLADVVSYNRRLSEMILEKLWKLELREGEENAERRLPINKKSR